MSSATPGGRPPLSPPQGVRLAASIEGPDSAPVVILANPIGTTRAIWDAQARVLREDFRLRVIRGASHLAPYQTPGPVTAAILAHLG